MPRPSRKRQNAEGKCRRLWLPTHRLSRSKVIQSGHPYRRRKSTTASIRSFRVKIRPGCCLKPGGRSGIHKIEYLHHMLLLAKRIRRHTGCILEIELNLFQRIGTLLWAARTMRCIQDTSELPQDAPDGARGARKRETLCLQLMVTREVVENRSRPWRPLEVLRRVFANLHNPLDDTRMDLGIGGVMGPRVREQHLQIIWGSVSHSLEPLLDPAQGTTQGV